MPAKKNKMWFEKEKKHQQQQQEQQQHQQQHIWKTIREEAIERVIRTSKQNNNSEKVWVKKRRMRRTGKLFAVVLREMHKEKSINHITSTHKK